jgi:hypothetical protein
LHRENFVEKAFDSDITLVNYPQIDYFLKDLSNAAGYEEKTAPRFGSQKFKSLSFLYWLQTVAGFSGLKLRNDVVGTDDGLGENALRPRVAAHQSRIYCLRTARFGGASPERKTFSPKNSMIRLASVFTALICIRRSAAIIIWMSKRYRFKFLGRVDSANDGKSACRVSKTSARRTSRTDVIACIQSNGISGEAAGALAAFCLGEKLQTVGGQKRRELLREFQNLLVKKGVELEWRKDLKSSLKATRTDTRFDFGF